jgi:lysylphosphatidylglycerol synthetase-like protein (DUF2156 family)
MMERIEDKVRRFPTLFGALIGLAIFAAIIVIETWFPRVGEAWRRNNANVRSVYFTVVLCAVWIFRLRHSRHRNPFLFWATLCSISLLHVIGVLSYSILVHPLLLREWFILFIAESIVIVFGLDWLTRRFARPNRHRHTDAATVIHAMGHPDDKS